MALEDGSDGRNKLSDSIDSYIQDGKEAREREREREIATF